MSPRFPTSHEPRSGGLRAAGERLLSRRHDDSTAVAENEARFVHRDDPRFADDRDDGLVRDEPRFSRDPIRDGVAPRHGLATPLTQARPATRRRGRRRGAAAAGLAATHGRRRRGGWLLPLLALLALGALVLGALSLLGGNDDKAKPRENQPRQQQPAQNPNAVKPGSLGIAGKGVATGAALTPFVGQQVDAKGMEVVQVDEQAGFFVGGGKGERTFVEWGPKAGGAEATQMPKVGDRVDITGPVAEAPKQPGRTFGVPVASERVILKQGGYVNADTVTPAR